MQIDATRRTQPEYSNLDWDSVTPPEVASLNNPAQMKSGLFPVKTTVLDINKAF